MATTLFTNIETLVQTRESTPAPLRGKEMKVLPGISHAFLMVEEEQILDFGSMENCPERADTVVDLSGRMVFPAWCDSHTHLVFATSREGEFVDRIKGLTYEEIAARGGGILHSARRLQEISEELLYERASVRLEEIMRLGTGAVEIKSGYGLTLDSELKMLRVIRKLKENYPVLIKSTFLGAHAVPMAFRSNRQEYLRLVIEEMLPRIAAEGLADYIDVFCEKVAFTVAETEQIIEAGMRYGLPAKIHTNQFFSLGGIEVSVRHGARSVDHLEVLTDDEIEVLRNSKTLATLLPSAPFFLNQGHFPPARKMLDEGLAVALASDYNPGTTPSGRMAFVLSLACIQMRMLPEEAVNAATINGAFAMDLADEVGSLTKGKMASFFIAKPMPSVAYLPYAFGSNMVDRVYLKGKLQS